MRIDKFLWCVRLFKSRSIATEQCAAGRVRIGEKEVKASFVVKAGDRFAVKQPPIWRVFEVLAIPPSRVGAKLVPGFVVDRTAPEEVEKQELARKVRADYRNQGEGRPTKRERRDIDRFTAE